MGVGYEAGVGHRAADTVWAKAQRHECTRHFCSGSLSYVPSPHRRSAPFPPPPSTATPLSTHLLQRPWERCALLPMDLGREHFWHMHSFPLKVTRSPGGKGNLKQDNELQARTICCSSLGEGGPHPRYTLSPSPGTSRTGASGRRLGISLSRGCRVPAV